MTDPVVQVQFEYTGLITTVFMHEPTRLLALGPDNKKGPIKLWQRKPSESKCQWAEGERQDRPQS